MTIYGSRDPQTMNSDPMPYHVWGAPRARRIGEPTPRDTFAPRPEFTPTLTHEHNPILVAFRDCEGASAEAWLYALNANPDESWDAFDYMDALEDALSLIRTPRGPGWEDITFERSVALEDHARRVLTRLANFEGGTE